jgi:hypothetical protein
MSTVVIDGFKLFKHLDGSMSIIINSDRIHECMQFYKEKQLSGVVITTAFNYELQNVDFLADYPEIKHLLISDGIKDVSAVHALKELNYRMLSGKNRKVDFINFPLLAKLNIVWSPYLTNLDTCAKLEGFVLRNYTPKNKDCSFISNITWLKQLVIIQSTLTHLNGLEKLDRLEKLEFYYCSKLGTLDYLETSKESLTYLFFDHCKSIINHEYVTRLHHLYTLAFNDCGAIPSIKFINSMPSLKDIRFMGTDVIDGNMTPCIGFKYAAFTNKRHFTHTMEQIEMLSSAKL